MMALFLAASPASAEYYRGEMNGWGTGNPMSNTTWASRWEVTILSDGDDGTSEFKYDQHGDWGTSWGAGTSGAKNSTLGRANGSGNLSFVESNGKYYTFRLNSDHDYYCVSETSGTLTDFATVSHNYNPTSSLEGPVTVTITLASAKNSEETIWLRYCTDGTFSTDYFVEATGSSTNYSASIPALADGTDVDFYVLTSTFPSNIVNSSDVDLVTLRGDDNGGAKYEYKVFAPKQKWNTTVNPVSTALGSTNLTVYFDTYQKAGNVQNRSWATVFTKAGNSNFTSGATEGIGVDPGASGDETDAGTHQFTSLGTWYYAMRVSYGVDTNYWVGSSNAAWTVMSATPPTASTLSITVTNLPESTAASAVTNTANPDTAVNLAWTRPDTYNVMIVRRQGADPDLPANGTSYAHDATYGTDNRNKVVYAPGSGSTDTDSGLTASTEYHYGFFTENYSYYSPGAFVTTTTAATVANLGNCWHIPTNAEPTSTTMRAPTTTPATNQSVYIYNGNQYQGAGNPGDQSGGTVYHRLKGPGGGWSSASLSFDSQNGNNKYWIGEIAGDTYVRTNEVEYYVKVTYTDHDTTFIGTTNNGTNSTTYSLEATAQSNPFTYRYSDETEPSAAYVSHADNRVSVGDDVQCWAKIGYAEGTGSNRWVDNAAIYYTTNGTTPTGGHGAASNAATKVQIMSFDHMEEDVYPDADAMWWVGTLTNLPDQTTIKYKIGAWKTASSAERFADYNTSGTNDNTFYFAQGVDTNGPVLTVGSLDGDYTTTKLFLDEIASESEEIVVTFEPNAADVTNVEIFSNLGRRDYVDVDYTNAYIAGDGYPDGINPPNGNLISTSDTGAYYTAYTMLSQGGGSYVWTGTVNRCGAYRLTARYQTTGMSSTNWNWYTGTGGRRDHAIVVSPRKVHELTMYELNTLTVEATDNTEAGRSTFVDLLGASDGDGDGYDYFSLDYLNYIQANCLWFQPIHPNAIERGDAFTPGSPYSTRDYFAVTPYMGSNGTAAGAMSEFTNFVVECDAYAGSVGTINVMLDGVFNHSSWDAEFGQGGVDLGFTATATNRMGALRPSWYSLVTDYGLPATSYSTSTNNNFATAPDRGDFGKWNDTAELFFGDYSALVRHNPDNNGDYLNEGDVYDFDGMSTNTMDLWRYFAYYTEYWLNKTGHGGTNTFVQADDDKGIDGLRCDFGQGLPPQAWEYIINRTRARKWNFVFMAETLDGGIPGYRSNRHFDILNESIVFQFTQSHVNNSWEIRSALEDRRSAYNGGSILLNLTSHDEVLPDNDAWLTATRYGAVSTVDGVPMVFYGQEKGIQNYNTTHTTNDGFKTAHEENFGKYVPHFKQWNKLTVWEEPPPNSDGLDQWYGRVNWARLNSPALQSPNRYFLSKNGGGDEAKILAVAKYETANASPTNSDVVLAFSLLFEHGAAHASASATYNLQPAWTLLGMDTNMHYNVRNLASSDASAYLWTTNKTGADLYNNGIYVSLPGDTVSITNDGALVQYLRVVEIVPDSPTMTVGPTSLAFSSELGGTPAAQTFTVTNIGDQVLLYTNAITYGASPGWLTLAPTNGSVAADATAVHTATVSQATSVGVYTATNTLTGNQTNGAQTVSVTYTVTALSDPTGFSAVTNTANPDTAIDLSWSKWNSKSVLIVRRKTDAVAWTPTPGTAYTNTQDLGSNTIVVRGSEAGTSVTDSGLEADTTYHYKIYSENYSYYSSGDTANETTETTPPAILTVGPTSLSFSTSLGGTPGTQTFVVTNTGSATLTYTNAISYGAGPGWLTLSPTNGSLSADATEVHTAAVSQATSVGTFQATNTLSGSQGNGPQTVTTTYTVSEIANPTAVFASAIGVTNLTVNWTKGSFDVMVVRRAGANPDSPSPGTSYADQETYGPSGRNRVIYAHGVGASDVDVGLDKNTVYHYGFFSENFSYYSSGAFLTTTTAIAQVDGIDNEWTGTAPTVVNSSTIDSGEFIWFDKQYERETDSGHAADMDMLEFRMLADADDVYFMVEFDDITDVAYPYVAIGVDTDRSSTDTSMDWLADDSDTVLSDGYYTNGNAAMHYPERNIIVHTVPAIGQRIELHANDGGTWYAPPTHGNDQVNFNGTDNFIEFKISRTDLGLSGAVTARLTVASFFNNTSIGDNQWANDGDTTANYGGTDAQDSLSLLPYGVGDAAGTNSATIEELSDNDMDSFFDVKFDANGIDDNTPPTAPDLSSTDPDVVFPANNSTAETGVITFNWPAGSDADDEVTSYFLEVSTNSNFGGENMAVAYRYNTRHTDTEQTTGSALTGTQYWWRVRSRDLSGALSGATTNMFLVSGTDDDQTGPTPTLIYVGASYEKDGPVQTAITDKDLINTNEHVDIAIVWTDPSGVFMTNSVITNQTNIGSEKGRVIPNFDLYTTNPIIPREVTYGFDQVFTNFYGNNGDVSVTTVYYNAFAITNSHNDDMYYLTLSAEDNDNDRGTYADIWDEGGGYGDPIPYDREVSTNTLVQFTVSDDDTLGPVFTAFNIDGAMYTNTHVADGLTVTGLIQDVGSGVYGGSSNRFVLYRNGVQIGARAFTNRPASDGDAKTSAEAVSVPLPGLEVTQTGTYTFVAIGTDYDGERDGDWESGTNSFSFTVVEPPAYGYHLEITLTGYDYPAPLTNFPVLVKLDESIQGFSYSTFSSATGGDLRFESGDRRQVLLHELELWDVSGVSYAWVRMPVFTNGASMWALWGNDETNAPAYTTNGTVWSEGYRGVFHLHATNGTTASDSTAYGHNGSLQNMDGSEWSPGVSANGLDFDGSDDYVQNTIAGVWTGAYTVAFWAKPASSNQTAGVGLFNSASDQFGVEFDASSPRNYIYTGAGTASLGPASTNWAFLVVTCDGTTTKTYRDGAFVASVVETRNEFDRYDIGIDSARAEEYQGLIDEVRIIEGAMSSNWVVAAYSNQVPNGVSAEEGTVLVNGTYFVVDMDEADAGVSLPYVESFDGLAAGALSGKGDWNAIVTVTAAVQSAVTYGTGQAVRVEQAAVWHGYGETDATNVYVDWHAMVVPRSYDPMPVRDVPLRSSVAFYVNTAGNCVVLSNGTWEAYTGVTLTSGEWARFTIRLDYDTDSWSLFAGGKTTNVVADVVATNLPFYGSSANRLLSFRVENDSASSPTYLDNLSVGSPQPMSVDLDGDGMSDVWEETYLDGLSTQDTDDTDNDGWLNWQEFAAGTDPDNPTSFLHVVGCDLAEAESDNMTLTLRGGDFSGPSTYHAAADAVGRVYNIYATDTPGSTKTLVGQSTDSLTGTNTWTDLNAVNESSLRLFSVGVSYGGREYTNAQEWIMQVQPRSASSHHLVCVPVDYAAGENNLNSTLGTQLARGLHANNTESAADKVRWINGAGAWVEYYLSVAAGWTENGSTPADVEIPPGKAVWIVRGSGDVTRSNTVMGGPSFSSSTVTNFTFSKDVAGGWTMFGWPLAQSRQHLGSLGSSNQLGFAAVGVGGTTGLRTSSSAGDELWVWNGTGWDWYWLADDHEGSSSANGQWYNGNDFNGPRDITLEPGKGYYYRHTTNWSSSNFNWTPEVP